MKKSNLFKTAVSGVLICSLLLSGCGSNNKGGNNSSGTNSANKNSSVVEDEKEDTSNLVPIDGDDGIDVTGIKTKSYDTAFVAGNAAYERYGFSKDISTRYANAVKQANKVLGGKTQIYDIVIPTAMDVTLPDGIRKTVSNSSDQREATKFIYDAIGSDATCVWIFDTLRQHKKEYLYFRTDHHWTALGGYYAYKEFCKAKGIKANPLSAYEKVTFDGFVGTFYDHTKDENLLNEKDVVEAYVPMGTNDMKFTDKNGKTTNWKIIKDVTSWGQGTKYNTFIGGDNPYSEIENPKINDGSSILIMKESFGNAMIPFFVDHYQHVYIVDYRYYTGTLSDFASQHKIDDMIFLSAISAGMGSGNLTKLENFLK